MSQNKIAIEGKILFDPVDLTKKHQRQSEWKRTAMVVFDWDTPRYYSWFVERRYGIILNRLIRPAHVTFINDRSSDMNGKWEEVKRKWDGRSISVEVDLDVRGNSEHWWLKALPNPELDSIRHELGLGPYFYTYHLTIGKVNEKSVDQSEYIIRMLTKGLSW